jgi:hypothetical protein
MRVWPNHADSFSRALHLALALQLESEHDEERRYGREVVSHDAHMLHALDRHALNTPPKGCEAIGL